MPLRERLRQLPSGAVRGTVAAVTGDQVQVRGLRLRVGDPVTVETSTRQIDGEVVALHDHGAQITLLEHATGLARGDRVRKPWAAENVPVGDGVRGRVLDALGRPLDGGGPLPAERVALYGPMPAALARRRIDTPMSVGVKVIDTMCTIGRGQRVGLVAGSGVGKSTLLGMIARGTDADRVVLALVGERGREVREFMEDELGADTLEHCTVVVATSDEPPLARLRAGWLATRIATAAADGGQDVVLLLDSLTRMAMAQRDIGLSAGELPTNGGYPPSVMSRLLPQLLEQAGPRESGTVTAFYTVLVEGDDIHDPVADHARSILDGHLVLDRNLAMAGRYPPVNPLQSLSRLASKLITPEQAAAAVRTRTLLSAVADVRDLVEVGAYVSGTNPVADAGLALREPLDAFLRQPPDAVVPATHAWEELAAIVGTNGQEATT
ncbi:MAG TPA: FliI/YscN family ATPase [Euzebyales bacterium]|nr:FliI/YscN family ATPase [Euzebyales bacterium]